MVARLGDGRRVDCRGLSEGSWGGDGMVCILIVIGVAQVYVSTCQTHNTTHQKVYSLYVNIKNKNKVGRKQEGVKVKTSTRKRK